MGTKAKTKAARVRAKRGRPQREGLVRTPGGRISRSFEAKISEERLAAEAATWKRRQANPVLSIEEARKQEHGSVIAKWLSDYRRVKKRHPEGNHPNEFTQLHYDTAVRFHQAYEAWLNAIAAKRQRSSSDFSGAGGMDGSDPFDAERQRRNAAAEADYKAARERILLSGPLGMMAVEAIVIENKAVEDLRGDLRLALNALAVLWKLRSAA